MLSNPNPNLNSAGHYMETNRWHWDEVTPVHVASAFYDVAGFKQQPDSLTPVETEELGDVAGKTLLHLQCHFGMDTISWAGRGALVTGVDFSPPAIAQARALAMELGIAARFLESNVYDLPERLQEQFDIVFTSYGALPWLPDLRRWAQVAARYVQPGGVFYLAEFHPFAAVFDDLPDDLRVRYPYFSTGAPVMPVMFEGEDADYADPTAKLEHRQTYLFPFTLADVVTALIEAGLQIEFLHEFPFSTYQFMPITRQHGKHDVRLFAHHGSIPLLFSVLARKPPLR